MSHHEEKQQLWIILLIVFLGFIGTSIAYPIFPPLFLHSTHESIIPSTWHTHARSIFLGLALAMYPLGQFIGSPILGGCSDRYGRKKILIISLVGGASGYFLSALALTMQSLWLLLLSRFLTGIMEGNFAIVRAMATDLEGINKFKSLGRINGMSAIGYVMGPLFGGFLSDKQLVPFFSFALPFFIATFFAVIAALLTVFKLRDKQKSFETSDVTIWKRFNLISRFKILFKNNALLKHLLIISTIFTFSVDIFYEFGPVYLTGLWAMTPASIALYTAILSFTLAFGSSFLPHLLSHYFSLRKVMIIAMFMSAIIFGMIALLPIRILVFLLFGLVGLSISTVNTNMTIQISNTAEKNIQGEAMGSQLSLRMLGDAIICLVGGVLITTSFVLPIAISCVIALIALVLYRRVKT